MNIPKLTRATTNLEIDKKFHLQISGQHRYFLWGQGGRASTNTAPQHEKSTSNLDRFPFVRTGRSDPTVFEENATILRSNCMITPRILLEAL